MIERINSADPAERDMTSSLAVLLPNAPAGDRRHCGAANGWVATSEAPGSPRSRSNKPASNQMDLTGSCRGIRSKMSTPSVIAEVLRCTVSLGSTVSTLQAFIGLAMETGPWSAGSITLVQSPELLSTAAYLGRRAADCDLLQRQIGAGPAHDALLAAPLQAAGDLKLDSRWPEFAARASSAGIHAVMSLRLFTNATLGTINLYAAQPFYISAGIAEGAQVIAAHASTILGHLLVEDHLERAVKSRTVIGQAQGMLMQRYGMTAENAFALLRRISQHNNVKIAALARELVATGCIRTVDVTSRD